MNQPQSIISDNPPNDGREWDCQCARCGSSMMSESCGRCGGEGFTAPGELYEEDPLWYDPDDYEFCHQCNGQGAWLLCLSGFDYCLLHPMPARIEVPPHSVEWFTVEARKEVG